MASITRFLQAKLKLKVNDKKSAVARPWARKFLGFSFTANREPKRRIAPNRPRLIATTTRAAAMKPIQISVFIWPVPGECGVKAGPF